MAKGSELQKHTLNLFAGDYEELQSMYPDVGAGPIIRRLVRDFLAKVQTNPAEVKVNVDI